MDPAHYVLLTTSALKAARDCRSKKARKRLRSAMLAVLSEEFRGMEEETCLMAAVAGTIKVVDDFTADAIQKELYGLGRISSLMQVTPEGEPPDPATMAQIEADMPPEDQRLGILVLWEAVRNELGIYRPDPDALGDAGRLDLGPRTPQN